ncbi:MAG: amino acid racemase [Proteobacteria bacterium]|nr:amino acid racemase [Pseudomonadota bacterium]
MQPGQHHSTSASVLSAGSLPLREHLLAPGQKLIPGIMGGMGPLPHIFFEAELLKQFKERGIGSEQQYPVWLLVNAAPMPDRTKALLAASDRCVAPLTAAGQALGEAGADFVVSICNTSHAFHQAVSQNLNKPWLNMLQVVAMRIDEMNPRPLKVGLLATDGTMKTGIFEESFSQYGAGDIEILRPSPMLQASVMEAIYHPHTGIKSGNSLAVGAEAHQKILEVAQELTAQGAEAIITGCTELSLDAEALARAGVKVVDPLRLLAETVLNISFGQDDLLRYCPWAA